MLKDKVILLTGGTGSFGHEFTAQALVLGAKTVRIFSRGWHKQKAMRQKFNDDQRLRWLIGDVRDKDRLRLAMIGVDIIVHAAALKDVPTAEYNPLECIKTNVFGSMNVIEAAIEARIPQTLFISTDKAVQAINLYGKTKACAESAFIHANVYNPEVRFSAVRYGNVMGSSGSVVPFWKERAKTGTLTITDTRMTRFWLTIQQGVVFVLGCLGAMQGGEIFVPKAPSAYLIDLAKVIAPSAEIKLAGVRPGEKLHEVLITREERWRTVEFKEGYAIMPHLKGGVLIGDRQEYSSEKNDKWLGSKELKEMLGCKSER